MPFAPISTRVLYALGIVSLGVAAGLFAHRLAAPLCGGDGRAAAAAGGPTDGLPPELVAWAVSSPARLKRRRGEAEEERGQQRPWDPNRRRPWSSYVYLPDSGRTIFVGEESGVEEGPDPVFLVTEESNHAPPRVMTDPSAGDPPRLRPPRGHPPSFLLVDNRTACFFFRFGGRRYYDRRCGTTCCSLACTDGRSVRTGETNVDDAVPPLFYGGRVWAKEDTPRGLHRVYSIDPRTMNETLRASFYMIEDYVDRDLIHWGFERVFVRDCRRPQLGISVFAGGLSVAGASLWVWTRAAMPFVAYAGVTATFYGVVAMATTVDDADNWFVSTPGWLVSIHSDKWYMSGWLIVTGLAMIFVWHRRSSRLRMTDDVRRHQRDRGPTLHFLCVGAVAYFCGTALLCALISPTLFLFLSSVPLLCLGAVSVHWLPTSLSALGSAATTMLWYDSSYAGPVAGLGLSLLASWQALRRCPPGGFCGHCPPAVNAAALSAGCLGYFCFAYRHMMHVWDDTNVGLFVFLLIPLLIFVGLRTGHALPLMLAVVGAIFVIVALDMVGLVLVVLGLVLVVLVTGMLLAITGVYTGMALCRVQRAVRNREFLRTPFRAQITGLRARGRPPLRRSVELAPFLEGGGEGHDIV